MDSIIDVNTLFGPLPAASVDLTVEVLLDLMSSGQISSACTLSTLGLLLDANIGNSATHAACEEYEQLIPAATLNPTTYFGDNSAIERVLEGNFRMVRFFPATQGWTIRYQPFADVLEVLQPTGLPVMVSVTHPGDITELESMIAFRSTLILAGVDSALLPEAISAMRRNPTWMVETSRLNAIGSVKLVADMVGPDRILFGSGAPAQSLAGALKAIEHSGLSDADCRLILSGNAERIL